MSVWSDRRLGRFTLPRGLFEVDDPATLLVLFSTVVILRAEFLMASNETEYHAWSPQFDVIEEGRRLPLYVATVTTERRGILRDRVVVQWKRMHDGGVFKPDLGKTYLAAKAETEFSNSPPQG